MTIDSVQALREHLQTAIEIEHGTLPPYLCALYSIKEGENREASEVIHSVFIEEMLHLTLAANLLNAVGGAPVLDAPDLLAAYPAFLPHSDCAVELSLQKFSPEAIELFMAIEKPGTHDCLPEDDAFETIGQFYDAIGEALARLSDQLGEQALFCGDPARQVSDTLYYGGSGRIIAVSDLDSARRALEEIVEQGEGIDHESIWDGDSDMFHPDRDEVAHYFRFSEIAHGRRFTAGDTPQSGPTGERFTVDWDAVHDMRTNPSSSDYAEGSAIRAAMGTFNRSYCGVLGLLQECFDGSPSVLGVATGAMYALKAQAIDLMALPSGDGVTTVGPRFEYVAPEDRNTVQGSIVVLHDGPYVVSGDVAIHDVQGDLRQSTGSWCLCRCGGSANKPFCDGTHARIDFDGSESADHGSIAGRRDRYPAPDGVTVYDDRRRCAHFGQCSDNLPGVFRVAEEPFVDPHGVTSADITKVVAACPSGALAYAIGDDPDPVEPVEAPSLKPIVDGPYRVRGAIEVVGADGRSYERRERQTLCRCGHSRNRPFCDGSHWHVGFRDPRARTADAIEPV